jgi:hypothetical protein
MSVPQKSVGEPSRERRYVFLKGAIVVARYTTTRGSV